MTRLNIERQKELEPKRMESALAQLKIRNLSPSKIDETQINFQFKGNTIQFYPYSGWHQGKGIKAGRGLDKLLKQVDGK